MDHFWDLLKTGCDFDIKNDYTRHYHTLAKPAMTIPTFFTNDIPLTIALSMNEINMSSAMAHMNACKIDYNHHNIYNNTPLLLVIKRFVYSTQHNLDTSDCLQLLSLMTPSLNVSILNTYFNKQTIISRDDYNKLQKDEHKDIIRLYNNCYKSSALLNASLIEFFFTDLPLYKGTLSAALQIISGFSGGQNRPLTVFHGTNTKIHGGTFNGFTTFGFLSTTTDISIARAYGNIIYAISLPEGFPYMNIHDLTNLQILLPIGTYIKMERYSINATIFFGTAVSTADKSEIMAAIQTSSSIYSYSPKMDYPSKELIKPKRLRAGLYTAQDAHGTSYMIKDVAFGTDDHDYICRRLMNEMLASRVYNHYGCRTLEFGLTQMDGKYTLCSRVEKVTYSFKPEQAKAVLQGYIVDCIVGNWDIWNNNNIGFLSEQQSDVIRTDVGGALAYRAKGDFKLGFFNKTSANEHIRFLSNDYVKKCVSVLQRDHTTESIVDIMFANAENHGQIGDIDIEPVFEPYTRFKEEILQRVRERHEHFISMRDSLLEALVNPPQTGGGGGLVRYKRAFFPVKQTRNGPSIVSDKKRVYLKDIQNYRYIGVGGGCSMDFALMDDVAYVSKRKTQIHSSQIIHRSGSRSRA